MFQFRLLRVFLSNKEAATAIEYGLIAALVGIAIIAALFLLSDAMTDMYNTITKAVQGSRTT